MDDFNKFIQAIFNDVLDCLVIFPNFGKNVETRLGVFFYREQETISISIFKSKKKTVYCFQLGTGSTLQFKLMETSLEALEIVLISQLKVFKELSGRKSRNAINFESFVKFLIRNNFTFETQSNYMLWFSYEKAICTISFNLDQVVFRSEALGFSENIISSDYEALTDFINRNILRLEDIPQ